MILGKISVSCSKHFKDKRLGDVLKRKQNEMINSLQCTFTANLMPEMMRCTVLSQAPPFFFMTVDAHVVARIMFKFESN